MMINFIDKVWQILSLSKHNIDIVIDSEFWAGENAHIVEFEINPNSFS